MKKEEIEKHIEEIKTLKQVLKEWKYFKKYYIHTSKIISDLDKRLEKLEKLKKWRKNEMSLLWREINISV